MFDATTIVGTLAAVLTTLSNWPQFKKCWDTGRADDLSFKAFAMLAAGLGLWIGYGALRGDWIIIASNIVGLALSLGILFFKLRGKWKGRS